MVTNHTSRSSNRQIQMLSSKLKIKEEPQPEVDSVDLISMVSENVETLQVRKKKLKDDSDKWDQYDWEKVKRRRELARLRQRRFRQKHNIRQTKSERQRMKQSYAQISDTKQVLSSCTPNTVECISVDLVSKVSKNTEAMRRYREKIKDDSEKWVKYKRDHAERNKKYRRQIDDLERLERQRKLARIRQRRFRERHNIRQKHEPKRPQQVCAEISKKDLNSDIPNCMDCSSVDLAPPQKVVRHYSLKIKNDSEKFDKYKRKQTEINKKCQRQFDELERLERRRKLARLRQRRFRERHKQKGSRAKTENEENLNLNLSNKNIQANKIDIIAPETKHTVVKTDECNDLIRETNMSTEKKHYVKERCELPNTREVLDSHILNITDYLSVELTFEQDSENAEVMQECKEELKNDSEKWENYKRYQRRINFLEKLYRQRESCRLRQQRFREKHRQKLHPSRKSTNTADKLQRQREHARARQRRFREKRKQKLISAQTSIDNPENLNINVSTENIQSGQVEEINPETKLIDVKKEDYIELQKEEQQDMSEEKQFKITENDDLQLAQQAHDNIYSPEQIIQPQINNTQDSINVDLSIKVSKNPDIMRRYKRILKDDMEKWEDYKINGIERNIKYQRQADFLVSLQRHRELSRLRQHRFREKQKFKSAQMLTNDLEDADPNVARENLEDADINVPSENLDDADINAVSGDLDVDADVASGNLEDAHINVTSENLKDAGTNIKIENLEDTNIPSENLIDAVTNVTSKNLDDSNSSVPGENVESQPIETSHLLIFPNQPKVDFTLKISNEAEVMRLYKENVINYLEKWQDFKRKKAELRKSQRQVNDFVKQQHHRELSRVRQRRYRERNKQRTGLSHTLNINIENLKTNIQTENE